EPPRQPAVVDGPAADTHRVREELDPDRERLGVHRRDRPPRPRLVGHGGPQLTPPLDEDLVLEEVVPSEPRSAFEDDDAHPGAGQLAGHDEPGRAGPDDAGLDLGMPAWC